MPLAMQSKELQATQARLQRLRDEEDKLRQQLQVRGGPRADVLRSALILKGSSAKTSLGTLSSSSRK